MAEKIETETNEKPGLVTAVVEDVTEMLDEAVDAVGNAISSEKGSKIAGGATLGALAAVALPISMVGGAILGAGYAVFRGRNK